MCFRKIVCLYKEKATTCFEHVHVFSGAKSLKRCTVNVKANVLVMAFSVCVI